ncbi:MAG: heavy metal translocating P-type ATPase [Gemmatimonadota bacterium]
MSPTDQASSRRSRPQVLTKPGVRGTVVLPITVLLAIAIELVLQATRLHALSRPFGLVMLAACSLPLLVRTVREGMHGNFATDAIAALSIITALALRQPLPGLIIVLMQSGGESLERMAQRRASRALAALEAGAPRLAHRMDETAIADVDVAQIRIGDLLLVRPGEVVPTDGLVEKGRSQVDTAQITGEPVPVSAVPGTRLYSGCANLSGPLVLRVTAPAAESQYERIVELVRSAQASKAPIQRLADRYAVWFTPLTIVVAGLTYAATGEMMRVLSVLVVATPCPLILATPIAMIGGMNSAARRNIIVRNGVALEQLSGVKAAVFDKTGTLTMGRPVVRRIVTAGGWDEARLLSLVAAVEEGSGHTIARAVQAYAQSRQIGPAEVDSVTEISGAGVRGRVGQYAIAVGSEDFINSEVGGPADGLPGTAGEMLRSYIAVDGVLAGHIEFDDVLRPDLPKLMAALRKAGLSWLAILSGDDADTVKAVASQVDVDEAHGDLKPPDKVAHVKQLLAKIGPTVMIGDGVNDAPALAAATVGIAISPRGGIAAETAGVVLLGEDLMRVHDAIQVSRQTLRIARQSIWVGLSLSGAGMLLAAWGFLHPIGGALYQEAIDVGVILNALRASRIRFPESAPVIQPAPAAVPAPGFQRFPDRTAEVS